jgi:hypothetical protein
MTAVGVLGSVDEPTDGTGGSVDTVVGAAIGPYWKSRLIPVSVLRDRIIVMRSA